MGVIVTEEGSKFVQPLPDHLVTSNFNTDNHTHLIYKRAVKDQSGSGRPECSVHGRNKYFCIDSNYNVR